MFNFFDLSIIPTFLTNFKVTKIVAIGLSNEEIINEIISFCIEQNPTLYAIDPKIDIKDLIKKFENEEKNNFEEKIEYFKEDSLNVLDQFKDYEAIFINGDPNWYTVYNELNLIRKNNFNFPLVFVCNNKYPHKRRDSYINPEKIPEEFKNECCNDLPILYEKDEETKRTMVKDGFCHAIQKDTPKNGVLTAIEDFLKENNSLKLLEVNPLEGVTLIYEPSEIVDTRINKILKDEQKYDCTLQELSDKFIENDILLRHVSRINVLKDDLDRVEEFKSEIKNKDDKINEIEEKIDLQNTQIKYQDSKLTNVESQISLNETKLQSAESKLLKKDAEIKVKEKEIHSKDAEIKSKEEEIENINSQLLIKENELENTKTRLINLESNFLENKKELEDVKKQLSNSSKNPQNLEIMKDTKEELNSIKKGLDEKDEQIKQKNAQIKSLNHRLNTLRHQTPNNSKYYGDDLINKDVEIEYLKKSDKLSKKIISPLSYIYILGRSKPKEIGTNMKLYRALKKSNSFDIGYYLNKYPDIPKSKWCKYFSPQLHYVCKGFDEKRTFNKEQSSAKNKKELLKDIENES